MDGLGLLENDLCWKLDARLPAEPLDLSRPSSRPPAIGEINVATATAATSTGEACLAPTPDFLIFLVNILLLLGPPNVTAAFAARISAAIISADATNPLRLYITLLFSRL